MIPTFVYPLGAPRMIPSTGSGNENPAATYTALQYRPNHSSTAKLGAWGVWVVVGFEPRVRVRVRVRVWVGLGLERRGYMLTAGNLLGIICISRLPPSVS